MGRDALILVDREKLRQLLIDILSEERSDIPMQYHERDADRYIEEIAHPSF